MKVNTGAIMACVLMVGSFSAFAQTAAPYTVRAGHNIIYMDWSTDARSTDRVTISTSDGIELGMMTAIPGKTAQLQLPAGENINAVNVNYNGDVHVISLQHGMGSGSNR
ncbi:hypothetical protein [Aeromonas veronii]|uniref:hypothetical protein n=1 Tax=Aeromonas veronii TaxID=654 RepID=UPI0032EC2FB6